MHTPNEPATPGSVTRRQFGTWMAAASLSACGGGGNSSTPGTETPPTPEIPSQPGTLVLVAGGLGGPGYNPGVGENARLPSYVYAAAVNPVGDLLFGAISPQEGWTLIPANGSVPVHLPLDLLFMEDAASQIVVDSAGRFVVPAAMPFPDTTGVQIHRLENRQWVLVAGGKAATAPIVDGRGTEAKIRSFGSPVLGSQGLIHFMDFSAETGAYHLRTLDAEGTVRTVVTNTPKGKLVSQSGGRVLLFAYDFSQLAAPGQWFELKVSAEGVQAWQALDNRWPNPPEGLLPIGPVADAVDTFWAKQMFPSAASTGTVMQYRLDGTLVATIPCEVPIVNAGVSSGSLLITGPMSIHRYTSTSGAVPAVRYGKEASAGSTDGQGAQARLRYSQGGPLHAVSAEAFLAANGDLFVGSAMEPMRRVSPQGTVSSLPKLKGVGRSLARHGSGDWLTIGAMYGTQIYRAPADGSGDWSPWVGAEAGSPIHANLAYLKTLRVDAQGVLWFAEAGYFSKRASNTAVGTIPTSGGNMIGQISPQGQVSAVAGQLDGTFNAASYPPEEQRPWYYDVVDFDLESAEVGWVLGSRPVLKNGGIQSYKPVLFRVQGPLVQRFELPEVNTSRATNSVSTLDMYTRLCLHPARPGEVFLASHCTVFRWTQAQGRVLLAGNPDVETGVQLGALPAGLGEVKFLVPGPTANSLYIGSENSVLRLNLPD